MKLKVPLFVTVISGVIAASANAADATILFAYTQTSLDMNGGLANLQAKVNSAISTCNQVHLNSFQGTNYVHWRTAAWYKTSGLADNRDGSSILNDLSNNVGGANTAAHNAHANLVSLSAATTDVGGIAWEPGAHSVIDAGWPYWQFYSHEIGHNYNGDHDQGICWSCNGSAYRTVMKHNYCDGTTVGYYSNPNIYTRCRYIGDSTHNNAQRIINTRWTRSNYYF